MGQPLTLRLAPTNLVDLVGRAVVEHQQTTQRHDLRVETGEATLVGKFDAVRLGRVLDNLLGNAIKYSPDGGNIMVSVTREEITGGGYALLAVHDEGIGIPADDQPRVFERFQRARNAVGRLSGSGIGLANVRQIVESPAARAQRLTVPCCGLRSGSQKPRRPASRLRARTFGSSGPLSSKPGTSSTHGRSARAG